jgi:trehalose/maltose transport system substrate-binding protein
MAATLTLVCGVNPQIHAFCRAIAEEWAAANGQSVRVVMAPADVQDRLQVYEELLGVADPGLDMLEIDVTWPGVLGAHLVDLKPLVDGTEQGIIPALLANNRVGGRLLALPWYLDFGVLFYRKDLLAAAGMAVPADWDALEVAAQAVQQAQREAGNGRFWGFVWQGWRSEALVCNAVEWLAGQGAGRIIDADGTVSVDSAAAAAALTRPLGWLNVISPPSVLSFTEDQSLAVFAEGNAAFLRHWPGAWATLNADDSPLAGKIGVAPLPKLPAQERHPATLGGWQLVVSRYSQQPALAAALVRHLTSSEVQRRLALELTPTANAQRSLSRPRGSGGAGGLAAPDGTASGIDPPPVRGGRGALSAGQPAVPGDAFRPSLRHRRRGCHHATAGPPATAPGRAA